MGESEHTQDMNIKKDTEIKTQLSSTIYLYSRIINEIDKLNINHYHKPKKEKRSLMQILKTFIIRTIDKIITMLTIS